ncbi:MAG: hypothetical protein AAF438_04945 [Pseudomonadota bacterium]
MKTQRLLACLVFLGMTNFAFAAADEWVGGTNGTQISYIQMTEDGTVRIYPVGGSWGGASCSGQSNIRLDASYGSSTTPSGYEKVLSILMAALVGKKKVQIDTSCPTTALIFKSVRVFD